MAPSASADDSSGDKVRPPLVSIGASAGGVSALQAFFEALPSETGAAYVVVVHLDPEHASDMARIIASRTSMPVVEVVQDQPIEPDKVYVIPPNRRLLVSADQISSASGSTQPGLGKICGSSFCAEATGRPVVSKTMARVLVVPWSMARMCLAAIPRS